MTKQTLASSKNQEDFFALNHHVAAEVDQRMLKFLSDKVAQAAKLDVRYGRLLQEVQRVVGLGGKRLRPTLAVVGYRAAGGNNDELALQAGVALEFLHTFMCVHDDIMDRDLLRHGGRNIAGRYHQTFQGVMNEMERDHLAQSMALLAGDLLLTFVYEVIGSLLVNSETRFSLISRVNETCFQTVGGQQLDVVYPLEGEVSVKRLLKIPYYKTAMYTFVNPLLFGANLVGIVPAKLDAALRGYGENLGITFQIIDDVLGMFGTTKATGKPITSDLRENKPTLLRHYVFEAASPSQHKILASAFGNPTATLAQLREVKQIVVQTGAKAKVVARAEQYMRQAQMAIEPLEQMAPEQHRQLSELAQFCLERDH